MKLGDITGVSAVANLLDTVITRVFPDKAAQEKARLELAQLQDTQDFQLLIEQVKTNQVEAASPSLFVSGWRPAVGWTCVAGLNYNFLVQPMLHWLSANIGWTKPPVLEVEVLIGLLTALLGVGIPRTIERIKNVARTN